MPRPTAFRWSEYPPGIAIDQCPYQRSRLRVNVTITDGGAQNDGHALRLPFLSWRGRQENVGDRRHAGDKGDCSRRCERRLVAGIGVIADATDPAAVAGPISVTESPISTHSWARTRERCPL